MKKENSYILHPNFILRTPLWPISLKNSINILEVSRQPLFREAIYIASPALYDQIVRWENGSLSDSKLIEKLKVSLLKYITRMSTRCTPYGMFASSATGIWGKASRIEINPSVQRHTRIDMDILCRISQSISANISVQPLLRYFPNNSIYEMGEMFRYVEYKYIQDTRSYQICQVERSEHLVAILEETKHGATIDRLKCLLISKQISEAEASSFIDELINNQILVSELEPNITGENFFSQLVNKLTLLQSPNPLSDLTSLIHLLKDLQIELREIDQNLGNSIDKYRAIFDKLKKLEIPISENHFLQTDTFRRNENITLDTKIQKQLYQALGFLNLFSSINKHTNLNRFKERFIAQYEEMEVPLLSVLDTESGIGYLGSDQIGLSVLLEDIYTPNKYGSAFETKWTSAQELLHTKLQNALKTKQFVIAFTESDFPNINDELPVLPDSFQIIFSLLDQNDKIHIKQCGGSNG
jgi:hypothetical protein